MYQIPGKYGGYSSTQRVPYKDIIELLARAEKETMPSMQYVGEDYDALAREVWVKLGKPEISLDSA